MVNAYWREARSRRLHGERAYRAMPVDAQETGAPLPAERPDVVAPTSATTDTYSLPRRVAIGQVDAIERVSTHAALRPVALAAFRRPVEA